MLNKIYKISIIPSIILLPLVTFAQLGQTEGILNRILDIVQTILIPLVFTLALLFFFYGVVKYIWSEGQNKAEGKQIMIWGVVALFVMSSVWGLVRFIQVDFNLSNNSNMQIPSITK
jgi:hypothetical protein